MIFTSTNVVKRAQKLLENSLEFSNLPEWHKQDMFTAMKQYSADVHKQVRSMPNPEKEYFNTCFLHLEHCSQDLRWIKVSLAQAAAELVEEEIKTLQSVLEQIKNL